MVTKVVMPKLSLTMKEGTVARWYKKEGETVQKNEPIVEIVSEKATMDLEAPVSGTLRKILVENGVDAPVNEVLALIGNPDETFTETDFTAETSETLAQTDERILASPAAKRVAKERNIDLSLVKGSGPEGRITEEDVERFSTESHMEQQKIRETIPLSGLRKMSAERVSSSFRTAPHSTVVMEADVSNSALLHKKLNVSYTAIIVKASANALQEHRQINSSLNNNQIMVYDDINVGVATNTENGLTVPVIRKTNSKSLREIDTAIAELSTRAREGKLSKEEVSGGTFTVTNLGMCEVDFFTPIINPPEAAILGVGRIVEKPIAVQGKVEVRPMMMLSLSYDHRIVDGAPAAEFLRTIKNNIEKGQLE
jgi:pyruvate dehydrogenase E2 component (dihydrolipoamide acetyltransferase)